MTEEFQPINAIKSSFELAGIAVVSLTRRDFPEESIFIIEVDESDLAKSSEIANQLDYLLQENEVNGFVTVRKCVNMDSRDSTKMTDGVKNSKVAKLLSLVSARSRTSELQPSLLYIPNTAVSVETVCAHRHHLIFGRRGVGKTALMVEAKRNVQDKGSIAAWINLQTLRLDSVSQAFGFACQRICSVMLERLNLTSKSVALQSLISQLDEDAGKIARSAEVESSALSRLIPQLQQVIRRFTDTFGCSIYIFVDELHYFKRSEQPRLLDALHAIARDNNAWLKVAGIRHLSKWFISHPPTGLQTGHDADHIDLDLTLEDPSSAKNFLESVLKSYCQNVGISTLNSLFLPDALDRLVLAAGAVPRDYLVLCAGAIKQAQRRERAKLVGVQDVNKAAGEAAKVKLSELEDDTSSSGNPSPLIDSLNVIRSFCLNDKLCTYFRIDFRDKEIRPIEYAKVQDLMDLRLVHLIEPSLSDEEQAGRRSEVYMIDLSQFSGQRLKKKLRALDLKNGILVLKFTGTAAAAKLGATTKQRHAILRRGPIFQLDQLI